MACVEEMMDATALIARFGGDEELVRELVALFVAECPRMLSEVRDSVARGCAEELRCSAHTFKGCVGNFTDGGPAEAARALEHIGREGHLSAAPAALAQLERDVEQLLAVMRQFA